MPSLRQKVAQMLIMGFSGTRIDATHPACYWLKEEEIGGVILFRHPLHHPSVAKNILCLEQTQCLNAQLQACAKEATLPPFIAVDYEGGEIDRLKGLAGAPQTLKPTLLAQLPRAEQEKLLETMAETLSTWGFNLNFAPVVDLGFNLPGSIIGPQGRAFSDCPKGVLAQAHPFTHAFHKKGVQCCYKHFPGHGSACGDTHLGFVDVTDTYSPLELEPYRQLSNQMMVMTAHVINKKLDATGLPATLSSTMLDGLLRRELGFDGVIVSDDMQMRAIVSSYSMPQALELAINAGVDMLIFGNQWGDHDASFLIDMILTLVQEGQIEKQRIDEAYARIKQLKTHFIARKYD